MIHDMTNYLLCYSLNQKCGVPIGAVLSMLTVVFMSTWMPTHIPKDAYDRTTAVWIKNNMSIHYVSCDAAAACHCMPGSDLILGSQNWVSHRAGRENLKGIVFNEKRMKFDVFGGFELKTWSLILIWFWCSWFTEAWRAGASSAMPDDFPDLTICHVRLENPNCLSSDPRRMWPYCARNTRAFHLIPFLQILILTLSLLIKYVKPLSVEKF